MVDSCGIVHIVRAYRSGKCANAVFFNGDYGVCCVSHYFNKGRSVMTKIQGWVVIALLCAIAGRVLTDFFSIGYLALAVATTIFAFIESQRGK
jgi:hypothetical protein